jgi:hypothetical protein
LLLHLGRICKPRIITSNDGGDEAGVTLGLFLKFKADGNTVFLLVITSHHSTHLLVAIP